MHFVQQDRCPPNPTDIHVSVKMEKIASCCHGTRVIFVRTFSFRFSVNAPILWRKTYERDNLYGLGGVISSQIAGGSFQMVPVIQ